MYVCIYIFIYLFILYAHIYTEPKLHIPSPRKPKKPGQRSSTFPGDHLLSARLHSAQWCGRRLWCDCFPRRPAPRAAAGSNDPPGHLRPLCWSEPRPTCGWKTWEVTGGEEVEEVEDLEMLTKSWTESRYGNKMIHIVIDVREFSLRCCCVESKRNCREWFWENKGSLQNLFATHLSLYLLQCFMICGAEHPHPTQTQFNPFLNCNNGYPANSCYHTAIWRWYPCITNHSSDNTVSLTLLLDKAP